MKYRVTRLVQLVEYAYIEADYPEDARSEAAWNPHQHEWIESSKNDPVVQDVTPAND
jgi:hypothetical protein